MARKKQADVTDEVLPVEGVVSEQPQQETVVEDVNIVAAPEPVEVKDLPLVVKPTAESVKISGNTVVRGKTTFAF